jgi:hypothetical protein
MKLISEQIKSKLIEEQTSFGWNEYTNNMINDLIELCNSLKGEELKNVSAAFRAGFHTEDKWSLELEIYDHILMHYDEEVLTYDQYQEEKKSTAFFKKNFVDEGQDQELLPCNCGEADRCNCHIAEGGQNE